MFSFVSKTLEWTVCILKNQTSSLKKNSLSAVQMTFPGHTKGLWFMIYFISAFEEKMILNVPKNFFSCSDLELQLVHKHEGQFTCPKKNPTETNTDKKEKKRRRSKSRC